VEFKAARSCRFKSVFLWLGPRISYIGLRIAAAALLVIVALNATNIILRYIFFSPFPWSEEAMLYLMIFGVYTGAVSVAWQQAHIRIDAFLNFAPPGRRRILEIVSSLVLAAILAPVVLASYRVANLLFQFGQRSDALHLPMWIPQGIIPTSLLLIVVMSLLRIFVHVTDEDSEARNDRSQT
jgi:C4-dicarboxylate transporter DctQ subunit